MARREVPQNPPGTRGLKRDGALVPLSRDHHFALREALWLRRAAEAPGPDGGRAVAEGFLRFYETDLLGHFSDEEDVLLRHARALEPEVTARIRAEHEEIHAGVRLLRSRLADGGDLREGMADLGQLLDDHVRLEERSFFQSVQARLAPEALRGLGAALEEHRAARGLAPSCPVTTR